MAKETSKPVASIAARLLQKPSTPKQVKRVAGSDLSQREKGGGKKK